MNVKQLKLIALLALAGVPTLAAYKNWNELVTSTDFDNAVTEVQTKAEGDFDALTSALATTNGLIARVEGFVAERKDNQNDIDLELAKAELAVLEELKAGVESKLQGRYSFAKLVPTKQQAIIATEIAGATAVAGAGVYFRNSIAGAVKATAAKATKLAKDHPYIAGATALGVAGSAAAGYLYTNWDSVKDSTENMIVFPDGLATRIYNSMRISVKMPSKRVVIVTTATAGASLVAIAGTLYIKKKGLPNMPEMPKAVTKALFILKNFNKITPHINDGTSEVINDVFKATQVAL